MVMSTLLLDQENDAATVIKRNGLVCTEDNDLDEPIKKIEKTIEDYTSNLPLGKTIYLLLNVHNHVFEKAVKSIKESTSTEILIKMSESPTIRAIMSIENYLAPNETLFKHVFDPLKEKILKRHPNEAAMHLIGYFILDSVHNKQIQQFFVQELSRSDKKTQLAIIILLQFLYKQSIVLRDNCRDMTLLFLPSLIYIIEECGQATTLLACSAYNIAAQFCQYNLLHLHDNYIKENDSLKIIELDGSCISSNTIDQILWSTIEQLLIILEKWHVSKNQLEIITYEALHKFLSYSKDNNTNKAIAGEWNRILTYLTPKAVLSDKPLTPKKQKKILDDKEISPLTHIILLILLQKGNWIKLYGLYHDTVVLSTDEEEIKSLLSKDCQAILKTNIPNIQSWIAQLTIQFPDLFSIEYIENEDLIQAILDQTTDESTETMIQLSSIIKKRPESSVCYLLFHVAQQDKQSKFAYHLLSYLIEYQNSNQIISILAKNLMSLLKTNNSACELLIKCMPYLRLLPLIQRLMQMASTILSDDRERMVYMALISKALLDERWSSDSILLYIDLIRDFKMQKGFISSNDLKEHDLTPCSISNNKKQQVKDELKEEQIESLCTVYMAPIQLWSMKINSEAFSLGLRQLVRYSYGIPRDTVSIESWKHLSFAFLKNHELIWPVIEECTNIMKTQIMITKDMIQNKSVKARQLKETILFLRINPMLILQIILVTVIF
ncbi:uncharacterized protein BX663DRAFT_501425 [Cokeromyces recurvatus]|uniref:uncharacterized protein n=1 Tax=Cokeromyces recurvatus TaxID=90255 RepID=UPI00221FA132|nr:uncharacterized protein BX663DRAFT_501425 [Cokeromyces recurvatus]KAI7905031.1 hypothetical protein BX663DRAFT_501425 [Cokeromyces recurvatus]